MFPKETKSAGGVVVNGDGKILIVSQYGNSRFLPKGGIDEGEDALSAAKRKIFEESDVKNLTFLKQLPTYKRHRMGPNPLEDDKSEMKIIEMFLFTTEDEKLKPTDPGNSEARWVEKEKVADMLTHLKDKEFFRNIRESV